MSKKIVISAGGTGGHLFPALALAQALRCDANADLLFLGGGLSCNRYFDSAVYPFKDVPCGSFVSKKPWNLLRSGFDIARGVAHSMTLLRQYRPDCVVGFGSFYGFPPLVAAKILGIPIILYAADVVPGRVLRLVAPYAKVTGTHFSATAPLLNGKSQTVGMPLRETLVNDRMSAATARLHFGLDPDRVTLLIFGGSQGAQRLNEMILDGLQELPKSAQVLHFTGSEALVAPLQQAYQRNHIPCCVKAFEDRMGLAWSAADLALGRSGAGTVAEMLLFEVPALLIPYPFATDGHQDKNADAVVELGGAIKLLQKTLTSSALISHLADLLNDLDGRRTAMRQALQKAKWRAPQQTLADLVWETLNNSKAS